VGTSLRVIGLAVSLWPFLDALEERCLSCHRRLTWFEFSSWRISPPQRPGVVPRE
jgi:hypothetical protein